MKSKKERVHFEYNDLNITAQAIVMNESEVYKLQWTVHNIGEDEALDDDTIEMINTQATELLIDKAFNPELDFE